MSSVGKFIPGNEVNNNLYKAIYYADVDKVKEIINCVGLSHSQSWSDGYDLLYTALDCKHINVAKLLVELGCKLKKPAGMITSEPSTSLLHLAVRQGDTELITMLLDRVMDSLTMMENGDTLLHTAVAEGREDVVKLLLERGVDVMCGNSSGMTPLHLAAGRGRVEILELLLSSRTDIDYRDKHGKTSLFHAVSSGHDIVVKTLLKRGANAQCKSKTGHSTLLNAVSKSYVEIAQDLLEFGADVNDRNIFGQTALHIACLQQNKYLVSILLNAGADINATDNTGLVPFDAILRKRINCSTYFENSSITYLMGRHLCLLSVGDFHLNMKNGMFYNLFYGMYFQEIAVREEVLSATSIALYSIVQQCQEEVSLMKKIKNDGGFTMYDVIRKLKNPLSMISENEISFIQSINLEENFESYKFIVRNLLKNAKLRNELVDLFQNWFSFLINVGEDKIPALPEEMRIHISCYLTNRELHQFIKCCEAIAKYKSDAEVNS